MLLRAYIWNLETISVWHNLSKALHLLECFMIHLLRYTVYHYESCGCIISTLKAQEEIQEDWRLAWLKNKIPEIGSWSNFTNENCSDLKKTSVVLSKLNLKVLQFLTIFILKLFFHEERKWLCQDTMKT